jgi:hypothetical protein
MFYELPRSVLLRIGGALIRLITADEDGARRRDRFSIRQAIGLIS